jgi:uncharacterized protein
MTALFQSVSGPITDDEIDRLAMLLDRYGDSDDGMNLEALDGYLSALVVGPSLVMPSEYMPGIWACEPVFDTAADARDAHALIMRLWNHIVWRVQQFLPEEGPPDEPRVVPLLAMPDGTDETDRDDPLLGLPADFPLAAAWAMGFMQGVELRVDEWQAWSERHEQIADDIERIFELTLVDPEQLEELETDDDAHLPDLASRVDVMVELPSILQDMYVQRQQDQRPQTVRAAHGPGRNDACPCGSGRKYKKCCGSAAGLH